ncbi:MAG: hypothetical protein GY749_34350 [Desulfobacteraceae bacterium]|nr:hypothetical protein [Desulfobacteraceae bacterium]MCP4348019.1 hypothetical protein [Desulfobacterales bacterium]
MLKNLRKKIVLKSIILAIAALLLFGCGKKAHPVAPGDNPDENKGQWETGCPCKGY